MADMGVQILGLEAALAEIRRVEGGAQAMGGYSASIGSPLPYAFGIHFGRHRGGKLARKAGGLFFLTRALEETRNRADMQQRLAEGVRQGPAAARQAGRTFAFAVLGRAQLLETAVVTGALRNSLQVVEGDGTMRPVTTPFGPAQRRSTPSLRRARR